MQKRASVGITSKTQSGVWCSGGATSQASRASPCCGCWHNTVPTKATKGSCSSCPPAVGETSTTRRCVCVQPRTRHVVLLQTVKHYVVGGHSKLQVNPQSTLFHSGVRIVAAARRTCRVLTWHLCGSHPALVCKFRDSRDKMWKL